MCITVHPHQLTDISKRSILHKIPSSLQTGFTKLPLEVTKHFFSGGGCTFFRVSVLKDCQHLASDIWSRICSHTIICYKLQKHLHIKCHHVLMAVGHQTTLAELPTSVVRKCYQKKKANNIFIDNRFLTLHKLIHDLRFPLWYC